MDYLHNHSELPIIHCDLKPSNVLLDQDMIAHVGDFGLSRIVEDDNIQISENHTSSVGIRGTIGYAAPGNFTFFFNRLLKSINDCSVLDNMMFRI